MILLFFVIFHLRCVQNVLYLQYNRKYRMTSPPSNIPTDRTSKALITKQLIRQSVKRSLNSGNRHYRHQQTKTQNTVCSIGVSNQEENSREIYNKLKRQYSKRSSDVFTNNQENSRYFTSPGKTRDFIDDKNFKSTIGTMSSLHRKKEKQSDESQIKNRSYVTQVKQIMGYLIEKLLSKSSSCNRNQQSILSRNGGRSPMTETFQSSSYLISNQKNIIKQQQGKLIDAQIKTNLLVQQLGNVKELWSKANSLRMELIKHQQNLKKQSQSRKNKTEQNSPRDSSKNILTNNQVSNQLNKFLLNFKKIEADRSSEQLKMFQNNIANHLVDLKERICRIQDATTVSTGFSSQKYQQMVQIIQHLQKRNDQLQSDNTKILQENQRIHTKICQLQDYYQEKTNELSNKIRQLNDQNQTLQVIMQQESRQYKSEIMSLRQEVTTLKDEKVNIIQEINTMKNTINILEVQRLELTNLVESYENRQSQTLKTNAQTISNLKEKISSLQAQVENIEEKYKQAQIIIQNSNQNKNYDFDASNNNGQCITQSIVLVKQDLTRTDQLEKQELKRIKEQLEEELEQCKALLHQKQQSTLLGVQSQIQVKNQSQMLVNLVQQFKQYLQKYSECSPQQKQKLISLFQKALNSKTGAIQLLKMQNDDPYKIADEIEQPQRVLHLSRRSFSRRSSSEGDPQPTYMQVFSKFDERQQCIFRLIDYIGSNLRSGDLLTQFVNEFIMKVMPNKEYQKYEQVAEEFILKVRDYQEKRTITVDKVLTDYIVNTQGIFKQKDNIQAALQQSSSDEDVNDKYLWEDILNPKLKQEQDQKHVIKRQRAPMRKAWAIYKKHSSKSSNNEKLPMILQQTERYKNISDLFSEQGFNAQFLTISKPETPLEKLQQKLDG